MSDRRILYFGPPISNSLLIIDFIGQMFGMGAQGCGLVAPGVQRTSVCMQLCLFFAMEGTNPLSLGAPMFSQEKYGCCFKVQIRYFVLCFVNCRVLKKIRGHVWVLFSFQHLPPTPDERKMESSDTPISIPLHWWISSPAK